MVELAAIGLASNILQFVEIGYKLTKRVLEFADDANELPNSIRHLYDRLPIILYVLNHVGKWNENGIDPLQDTTRLSLLSVIIESRDCAQELFDILEDLRPRPDSRTFKRAFKAVKSISKEDSIQTLITTLDKNIALLNAYQNLVNTSAVQKLAKDSSANFTPLTTDITIGFKHVLSGPSCWIWHRKQFLDWRKDSPAQSGGSYLWIHGTSGMGKTFLAAQILEDMSKSNEGSVFAYFCRHETKGHFSTQILRSLLSRMVIADNTNAALELAHPFFKARKSPSANYDELWSMFQAIVSNVDNYVFIIDGLDEYTRSEIDDLPDVNSMPSAKLLPSFLHRLVQATASAACRILIVSRDYREIRLALGRARNYQMASVTEYGICESDLQADALLLARHIVNTKLPKQDSALRDELAQSIAEKSAGQMLWVRLQEQILKPSYKDKKLRQLVQNMPTGLRETYDKQVVAMMRLPHADKDRAWRLLRWVLFARDPMTIHLLIEAMLVDISSPDDTFSDDELPRDMNEDDVSDEIKQLCQFVDFGRSSLEQEQRHWVVAFPHASRKEHLLSIDDDYHLPELQSLRFADRAFQESILTQTCLFFLSLTNVWSSPDSEDTDLKEVVNHRPFLRYAILNWPYHATYGIFEEECRTAVAKFCAADNMAWCRWRDGFEKLTAESCQEDAPQSEPGNRMYYACDFGYLGLIEQLLRSAEDPTKPCGRKGSPMHAAIAHSNAEIIKLLLDHTRDLNVRNLQGETLIHSMITSASDIQRSVPSAIHGDYFAGNIFRRTSSLPFTSDQQREIISRLLDSGSDPTATDKAGWTCINKAAAKGQFEVVELLIKRGADVNVANNNQRTPIISAADGGHKKVVELLIQHGADITNADDDGTTAVHAAANEGHFEVVELLINCGADISVANNVGRTPIHSASAGGYQNTVELLIRSGASLMTSDPNGLTPVWLAASNGHKEVIELLLQYGADYSTPCIGGNTPLHAAVYHGHKEVVELLIQREEDFRKMCNSKRTPLYYAALRGRKDIVDLLIKQGADVLVPFVDSQTALYAAAFSGHHEIAERLLQNGADVTKCNGDGFSPLTATAQEGHKEVVELLLRHGADINAANTSNGWTPLFAAAGYGQHEMVELLIQHGAGTTSRDTGGLTPIHHAVVKGRSEVVKLLLQHGADANSCTLNNETLLYSAALSGRVDLVELLLQHGADLEAVDAANGGSPLYHAASEGHEAVVELLLRHGADITHRNHRGGTPLLTATVYGRVKAAEILISHGADMTRAYKAGYPLVAAAAGCGHKPMVELLLQYGGKIDEADIYGLTPIYYAVKNGHSGDLIQFLMDKGADIDLHDGYYTSSLFASLSYGSERLAEAQIAAGSVLRTRDFRSVGSALAAALGKFSCSKVGLILGLIKNEKYYPEALQELACLATERSWASDVRQKLIDAGASLQLPGVYGWTPAQCIDMCDTLRPQSGSSNSLPAPTRWSPFDNENVLQLLDDGREVLVQESAREVHLNCRVKVHADFFMPADRDAFYFEVTFLAVGPWCLIVVGFSHLECPIAGMPGWDPASWGYHGDDGLKFADTETGDKYGPLYGEGDTIGCGVDFNERSAFFTKNGVHLGTAFTGLTGRLLPTCGFGERGTRARVNFGDEPFMYKRAISSAETVTAP